MRSLVLMIFALTTARSISGPSPAAAGSAIASAKAACAEAEAKIDLLQPLLAQARNWGEWNRRAAEADAEFKALEDVTRREVPV